MDAAAAPEPEPRGGTGRAQAAPAELPSDTWAAFAARLRAYVRRRVEPAAAEDVVGDILVRLVHHRDALAAAEAPTAWMLRVAANAVTDHYRRRAVEQQALARLAKESGDADTVPEVEESAESEIARCLVPLIHGLPGPYGPALLLTEIDGLSHAVAARRLGISAAAMKSRVRRARAKLKQALLRCCAIELDRRGSVLAYRPRRGDCRGRCT